MRMDEIIALVEGLDGALTLRPGPGDGSPEAAWGDTFVAYAPDGVWPAGPGFATVVTSDQPGDDSSRLSRPGAFRVNLAAGREEFVRWTGYLPRETPADHRVDRDDVLTAHPVYGSLGWLCVVNPAERTSEVLPDLLRTAHRLARARWERRTDVP